MKPHKHAELIKQWAEGAEIQYRAHGNDNRWVDTSYPAWVEDYEYRIKPAREYPSLAEDAIASIASYFCLQPGTIEAVSNRTLRLALDAGQVVTREEFDRALSERRARDMNIAFATLAAVKTVINGYSTACLHHLNGKVNIPAIIAGVK